MNLKKPKQEVLNQINANVSGIIYNHLSNNLGNSMRIDAGGLTYTLQQAIAIAVTEGFRTLLENQYTDDDFENDMALKP